MLFHKLGITIVLLTVMAGCETVADKKYLQQQKKNETLCCERDQIDNNEVVTFFPSYAYKHEDQWIFKIEGWIREPQDNKNLRNFFKNGFKLITGRKIQNESDFWSRMKGIASNNIGQEVITIYLGDKKYTLSESTNGGRISDEIKLSDSEVAALPINLGNWVPYYAKAINGRLFHGKVRLMDPEGISVVSDIDDTIKISEVFRGTSVLLHNTFNKVPKPTQGMAEFYDLLKSEQNAKFHYLSGSPWQLYNFLEKFRNDFGFPEGTFELKELRVNITSSEFWRFLASDATEVHKKGYIRDLLENYPKRQFILIGDSGEKDPDIYAWALDNYKDQIRAVYIRHVPSKTKGKWTKKDILTLFSANKERVKFINMRSGAIE